MNIDQSKSTKDALTDTQMSAILNALDLDDQKTNAKQYPQIFYAKHMETGLAGYDKETILIDTDAIKRMMPTFKGKPVYVHHVNQVNLENIKYEAHGYVIETFYNEVDGWVWSKILLVDDVAFQAVKNGWSVSNAYIPTEYTKGGTWHNCPYDRKILNGEFTHLALVPDPRYEGACIMTPEEFKMYGENERARLKELQNSKKTKKGKKMFNIFKNEKTEVTEIDEHTMVEFQNSNGDTVAVSVADLVKAQEDAFENAKKEEEQKVNMDTAVKVGEKDVTIKELIENYTKMSEKKNAEDESEQKEDSCDKDEKKNSSDAEEETENAAEEETEKQNASDADGEEEKPEGKDHFEELKNAHKKGTQIANSVDLGMDKEKRGQELYGSGQ